MIELTKVKSSLISGVHYDAEKKVLSVEFLRRQNEGQRRIYQYQDVPPEKVKEMLADKSVGGYFLAKIKPDYKFTRIDEDVPTDAKTEGTDKVSEVRQEQSDS